MIGSPFNPCAPGRRDFDRVQTYTKPSSFTPRAPGGRDTNNPRMARAARTTFNLRAPGRRDSKLAMYGAHFSPFNPCAPVRLDGGQLLFQIGLHPQRARRHNHRPLLTGTHEPDRRDDR